MLESQRSRTLCGMVVKHIKILGMLKTNRSEPNQAICVVVKSRRGLRFLWEMKTKTKTKPEWTPEVIFNQISCPVWFRF